MIVQSLKAKKDKAVRHKAEIEQRWMQDERQYWGFRLPEEGEDECPPVDNKTQQKVDTAAARLGDMLFPTNDRNWALKNTPHPTDIDGVEIPNDMAEAAVEQAEQKIDDYLNECGYAKHGRQAIFDACKLGIGVIKGPFARSSTRRVVRRGQVPLTDEFGQPVFQLDPFGNPVIDETGQPVPEMAQSVELQIVEETKPASARVDPWMFFPLPCRAMDECEGVFEMHLYPRQKLASLARHPGFDADAIRTVIAADPVVTDVEASLLRERQQLLRTDNEPHRHYVVWEYHGPIEREWLQEYGLDLGEDPLEMYVGEAWFCGPDLLKLELNAILGDERVPYYVLPYKRDDADILNSWGLPRSMRDDQRTIDIIFEAMHHNSRLCSGPQTVIFDGKAVPADGKFTIEGPKTWRISDPSVTSIAEIIQFQNVPSVINQLIPMYEIAKANADENTQLPAMMQGEAMNSVPTASGMAMVMNASNIVQRRLAHAWDDEITIPMLTRYYWWLMEFDEDDSIKVEMEVDPRGSSYLIVKDMQAQHGMMALQLAGQDPELRQRLKMDELYQTVFNFLDVPTDRLFKSEDEIAQEGESPDAQMQQQALQLELQKAQADAEKAMAEAQKAMAEAQALGQPDQSAGLEYEREQMRYQGQMAELETRLLIAQMERDAKIAAVSADKEIKVTELQAKLQTNQQDQAMKAQLEQLRLNQKEMDSRRKQYTEGVKAAISARQKDLRAQQYELRKENMQKGFDSF